MSRLTRIMTVVMAAAVLMVLRTAKAEDSVALGPIVVTPSRYATSVEKTPSAMTVLSQEDFREANAQTVLDAIRPVPNILVRDLYGNAAKASVDLRGFGEQGSLNVLVLVDGRRVNEIDLSGVSWTQIPLDQVERIEVVRGGAGAVLYGDNATGGVINIITKRGDGAFHGETATEFGSYDRNGQKVSVSGAHKKLSYFTSASRGSSHGFRNNSYTKSDDGAGKLEYAFSEKTQVRGSAGYHRIAYGLPGALSGSDLTNFGRRYSKYGDDHAKERDYYLALGATQKLMERLDADMDISFRKKNVFSNFVGANSGWNPIVKSYIETLGFTPKARYGHDLFGKKGKLVSGFDFYRNDYSSNSYNSAEVIQNFIDVNRYSFSGYAQEEVALTNALTLTGGYRSEWDRYEFDYHDTTGANPDMDSDLKPDAYAYQLGAIYTYAQESSIFGTINRSFRLPVVDEFQYYDAAFSLRLNPALQPQSSMTYEAGIRHTFSPSLKVQLNGFSSVTENELVYNPIGGPTATGWNENYGTIHRAGVEATAEARVASRIGLSGAYTFNRAVFADETFHKNDVPLSARHKASYGVRFFAPGGFTAACTGNYVGSRYFINDQANRFTRLKPYATVDVSLTWERGGWSAMAGINNMFNQKYSEYGVCNATTGAKNFYPSPERNFVGSVTYRF